jgi:hypothetical protein
MKTIKAQFSAPDFQVDEFNARRMNLHWWLGTKVAYFESFWTSAVGVEP